MRINLWDRDNAKTYIESGHLIIGRSTDLSAKLRTVTLEAEESGGQQESQGGAVGSFPSERNWP